MLAELERVNSSNDVSTRKGFPPRLMISQTQLSQTEQRPEEKNGTLSYSDVWSERPSTCGITPASISRHAQRLLVTSLRVRAGLTNGWA